MPYFIQWALRCEIGVCNLHIHKAVWWGSVGAHAVLEILSEELSLYLRNYF